MAKRIYVRVPDDIYEKVVMWAERFGVNQSQLGGMALQAGLDQILRSIDPIGSITPEQMEKILKAAEGADITVKLPEERENKDAGQN